MQILRLRKINVFSLFYGGGLLAGLLGAVSMGPAIDRQICTVIVLVVGLCAFPKIFNTGLVQRCNGLLVAALVLLIGLSAVGALVRPSRINLIYSIDFIWILCMFAIVLLLSQTRAYLLRNVVLLFVGVILLVAIAQVSYMFFGVGMDPTMVANLETEYNSLSYSHVGVRSIFVNTNDLAVAGCLALLFIMYGCRMKNRSVAIATAVIGAMVALSGSRGGFVVLVAITVGYYLASWRRMLMASLIAVFVVLLLAYLFSNPNFALSNSYFFTKLSTISKIVGEYFLGDVQQGMANSTSLRMDTYRQFAEKFLHIGFGSFVAQDYGYIIKGSWLMAQDPHSLPIELGLLYGYFGIAAFFSIMVWMFVVLSQSFGALAALAFCAIFFILCFESSSSIGHRAFWGLFFAFICGVREMAHARLNHSSKKIAPPPGSCVQNGAL